MRTLTVCALCGLFTGICAAVVTHETITYPGSVNRISGTVVGYGNLNPEVKVEVFDKPEVWADDSLSLNEKRKRQKRIATASTDSKGKFHFRGMPKGSYEIQFSTGNGGWNVLSVLVNVDAAASHDRLCVQLSLEGAGPKSSVEACH